MSEPITRFCGRHHFLSNFQMCAILFEGQRYPSVEHAYHAAKTDDQSWRFLLLRGSPGEAKRIGRRLPLRHNWEGMKIGVMRQLVTYKFTEHEALRRQLLATGDALLVEGNTHGDRFWGQVNGVGENWLGRILVDVRAGLRGERQADTTTTGADSRVTTTITIQGTFGSTCDNGTSRG